MEVQKAPRLPGWAGQCLLAASPLEELSIRNGFFAEQQFGSPKLKVCTRGIVGGQRRRVLVRSWAGEVVSVFLPGALGMLSLTLAAGSSPAVCGCSPQPVRGVCWCVCPCVRVSVPAWTCVCLWPSSGHFSMHGFGLGPVKLGACRTPGEVRCQRQYVRLGAAKNPRYLA